MIRTYRSKKETGGGLDRKDLIQNLDEKSSAFDAFYIQNIKQTKRELSCVGSSNPYGVASNKVRKRKYVRRILKEVDTRPRESLSKSAYLTPDKSLRVNKPLDPFDMLLNSSPACLVDAAGDMARTVSKTADLSDEIVAKKESRTYRRRKPIKAKKYNFSSSESDSDKENSDQQINITKNTSDIKTYKLLVEQEPISRPKEFDESINKIVKNISLLNRLQLKNSFNESMKKSLRYNRNRLTNTFQSPILQKSPLCSTPFKAKYRGESIFKFSPISVTIESSPKCMSMAEDDGNASVIFLGKDVSPKVDENNGPINVTANNSVIECNVVNEVLETNKVHCNVEAIEYDTNENDFKDEIIVSEEISSCQTTEIEPFMGFSNSEINRLVNVKNELAIKIVNGDTMSENKIPEIEVNEITSEGYNDNVNEEETLPYPDYIKDSYQSIVEENEQVVIIPNINESNEEYDENSISSSVNSEKTDANHSLSESSDKESFYDTCSSDRSSGNKNIAIREPVIQIERMNDSVFLRYYEKMPVYGSDEENDSDKHNSLTENTEEFASFNNSHSSDDDKSFKEIENNILDHENIENNLSENELDVYSGTDNASSNDDDLKYNSDSGEKYVSFVTTRRRNELTNNSMISMFDNSFGSSSTGCDKTVLSNNNVDENVNSLNTDDTLYKLNTNEFINGSNDESVWKEVISKNDKDTEFTEEIGTSLVTNKNSSIVARKSSTKLRKTIQIPDTSHKSEIDTEFSEDDKRMSFITTRKSSIAARKSSKMARKSTSRDSRGQSPNDTRKSIFDIKQGIVLQPGKKWERSLSIYRRMTMITDHFDQSILEDETLDMKGRKYRQSVISTMEMQDLHGSLHNESINSRRSTFVSKPSRSTIRIVKDPSISRLSVCNTTVFDDLKGFLNEECDDTIVDLSKLSIADQTHEVTVIDNFHDTSSRLVTARDYVLRRCNQTDAILFDECYPDTVLKNCHKIGEGVYGEVFLWRARDGRARVLKIVPIAGAIKVNGECQKDYHEIISEIVIAMELSALRAPIAEIQRHFDEGKDVDALDLHAIENATNVFNEVLAVRCVYGSYPSRLLDLWDLYDECKGSENDNPAILPVDQQYIVLELANAGQDLESYEFNNAEQAHALFLQVAYGLAVGEEAFQFEHRDLHWGNVLIAPTEQKFTTFVLRGRLHRVACGGVAATIIDYSLSRVALPLAGDSAALYNDLAADDSLFDAVGDYQFEVYRLMREKLGNDWKNFEPYTNILWLHYTVDKMITALRYKRTASKTHKHYIEKLKGIKARILGYGSAALFVLTDNEI